MKESVLLAHMPLHEQSHPKTHVFHKLFKDSGATLPLVTKGLSFKNW